MSELPITTTQNVNINFSLASIGARILGQILDNVFKVCYVIFIFFVLDFFNFYRFIDNMDDWSIIAIFIILFLPVIFYSFYQELIWNGQTLGKKIMKIRVIKLDGYTAGVADYLIRWLFRTVEISIGSGIIGLLAIIFSKKNQRLGDIAASTAVISLKQDISINQTILLNLKDDYKPVFPSVIRLSDNDVRIIKEAYINAVKSKDSKTVKKLSLKIQEVTGITDPQMKDADFIKTVLKDYNFYTQEM